MKSLGGLIGAVVVITLAIVIKSAAYTVSEVEQVIITQFGEPMGEPITDPGLHLKVPFIQKVNRFDKRWLEWDGAADEMPTKEKTYIWVDAYARWRIADPLRFFLRVGDERGAQSRLDDIIDSEVRNVIAAYELKEVVRLTNRALPVAGYDEDKAAAANAKLDQAENAAAGTTFEQDTLPVQNAVEHKKINEDIVMGRDKLTRLVLKKAQKAMPEYGIELVDVQFQRVNYTQSVEKEVFLRMISERNRIAELYRSQGKGAALDIRGQMKKELDEIESTAYRTAQIEKGTADAKATAIYAAAHNLDPSLYRLLKSLESYKTTVDANTTLLLSTDNDYFEAMQKMR